MTYERCRLSRPENFNSNHYNFDCEALDSVKLWICILMLTLLGYRIVIKTRPNAYRCDRISWSSIGPLLSWSSPQPHPYPGPSPLLLLVLRPLLLLYFGPIWSFIWTLIWSLNIWSLIGLYINMVEIYLLISCLFIYNLQFTIYLRGCSQITSSYFAGFWTIYIVNHSTIII